MRNNDGRRGTARPPPGLLFIDFRVTEASRRDWGWMHCTLTYSSHKYTVSDRLHPGHLYSSGGPASCSGNTYTAPVALPVASPSKGQSNKKQKKPSPTDGASPTKGAESKKNTGICLKEKQRKAPSVCQSEKYAKVVRQSEKYAKRGKRYLAGSLWRCARSASKLPNGSHIIAHRVPTMAVRGEPQEA